MTNEHGHPEDEPAVEGSGPWLRAERRARGLSQAGLARLCGLRPARLSHWEQGKARPRPDEVLALRRALRCFDESGAGRAKFNWRRVHGEDARDCGGRRPVEADAVEAFAATRASPWSHRRRMDGVGGGGLRTLSLFSGCGGMSAGFAYAGYDLAGHVEIEAAARAVHLRNFPACPALGGDIGQLTADDLAALGPVDVVFGGPPCQGFSLTGKRRVDDPRNLLWREFLRVVGILRPAVFVMENVRLMASMRSPTGGLVTDEMARAFSALGYRLAMGGLDAADFGVPQSRARWFVIGSLDATPSLPPARPGPVRTLRDAIGDLAPLEAGEADARDPLHVAVRHPAHVVAMLRDVPEGMSAHDHPDPALRPRSGYNTTYKRLRWDAPASTVSTTFAMISGSRNVHPQATRALTIREAARCQSFPDDFVFFGTLGQVRGMIGNAVPPLLALAVARHVRSLVPRVRFERTTYRLQGGCSTTELTRPADGRTRKQATL